MPIAVGTPPSAAHLTPRYCQVNSDKRGNRTVEGMGKGGGATGQARAGVPVTVRQVAKRSARVWR